MAHKKLQNKTFHNISFKQTCGVGGHLFGEEVTDRVEPRHRGLRTRVEVTDLTVVVMETLVSGAILTNAVLQTRVSTTRTVQKSSVTGQTPDK